MFAPMKLFWILWGFIAGFAVPHQAGINSHLARYLDTPFHAALISFTVGLISVLFFCFMSGAGLPSISEVSKIDNLWLCGGMIGAFSVISAIILAPKLGAAGLISLLVAGQLCASVALDHFGKLGFTEHPINTARIMGVALIIGGVILVQRF